MKETKDLDLQLFSGNDTPAKRYRILENTTVTINGKKTELVRNVVIRRTVNGNIVGVEGDGSEIDLDAGIIKALADSGVIEEIVNAEVDLVVDTDVAADTDLFGKVISDLQEGVGIGDFEITGTLKYIADYSSAFGTGMDSGNYLCIHCTSRTPGAVITVQVVNGTYGPATLDDDGIAILYIADKTTQKVKVVATANGRSVTHEYGLTGLTLNAAS